MSQVASFLGAGRGRLVKARERCDDPTHRCPNKEEQDQDFQGRETATERNMSNVSAPRRRHALGLPAGSVRATHLLVITVILSMLLVIPDRNGEPLPFPAYLVYLFFLMVGHYFGARGTLPTAPGEHAPLYLPRGFIRVLILAGLAAAIVYRLYQDPASLERQFSKSLDELKTEPLLPLFILCGFLAGVLLRLIVGRENPTVWLQDLEAWLSLIGLVGLGISLVIHLIINPSMDSKIEIPHWDIAMATLVAFYFGARS
jgi:hypothetical protein